jgi:hypothetical protein
MPKPAINSRRHSNHSTMVLRGVSFLRAVMELLPLAAPGYAAADFNVPNCRD